MLGMVLAFLAGLPTPQDTTTLDAPVYANEAYGVSLPRPFPDWVFEPGIGPQATTVIFHPRATSLREQLWGALVLATFPGQVPLRQVAESRLESTWRRRLGRSFALEASDSLTVAGLPAMRTLVGGAIEHVALEVEEYTIARGGDLIVLQLRYPRGLPRDSIAAGYQRVVAGLRIRSGAPPGPMLRSVAAGDVPTADVVPRTDWEALAYDALVRYDSEEARADFAVRVDLQNQGAVAADSVPIWVWPALTVDSVRGAVALLASHASASVLWARLPDPVLSQGGASLTVFYHAAAAEQQIPSRLMQLSARGAVAAVDWLPRVQPTLDSTSQFVQIPRARFTLSFDLPETWRAVASGRPTSDDTSAGRRHMTWSSDQVATSAAPFALGPYRVAARPEGGVGVSVWLPRPDAPSIATIDSLAAAVRMAWAFCSRAFGRLPLDEIEVVETDVPGIRGYAGLLLLGHDAVAEALADTAVDASFVPALSDLARELARTWWGNSVAAAGPGSAWIADAFPAWTAVAIRGAVEGDSVRQRLVGEADSLWHALPRDLDLPLGRAPVSGSSVDLLRSKGVAAIEAARRSAGDARFREALLTLTVEHRNGSIRLDDVLEALGATPAAVLRSLLF